MTGSKLLPSGTFGWLLSRRTARLQAPCVKILAGSKSTPITCPPFLKDYQVEQRLKLATVKFPNFHPVHRPYVASFARYANSDHIICKFPSHATTCLSTACKLHARADGFRGFSLFLHAGTASRPGKIDLS